MAAFRAIVVGGGVAGWCAAAEVARRGQRVLLLDRRAERPPDRRLPVWGGDRAARALLARLAIAPLLEPLALAGAGGAELLRPPRLPPPLHFGAALARLGALSFADRALALRVAAALRAPSRMAPAPDEREPLDAWLGRLGQSPRSRRALWHPLARALAASPPEVASATLVAAALRDLVLSADEPRLAAGSFARADLERAARRVIDDAAGEVRLGAAVQAVAVRTAGDASSAHGVVLEGGDTLECDAVIAAVPPHELERLVPESARRGETYFDGPIRLAFADSAQVTFASHASAPALCLPGGDARYIARDPAGALAVELTGEASADDDREVIERARRTLARALPDAAAGDPVLVRRAAACALDPPGVELDRPKVRTPIDGLFVAAPWVRSGLPASFESCARAAELAGALAADYEPPPPPPPPQGFVPLGNLRRRAAP